MTRKKINILVTCAAGSTIATLVRMLNKSTEFDYRVIGVDSNQVAIKPAYVDVFRLVPSGSDDNYIDVISEIIIQESIDVILPGSDEEAIAISAKKDRLKSLGAIPLVSDIECLQLITNKYETYLQLKKNDIPVPEFTAVKSKAELKSALKKYGYPDNTVIVKPACGRGGRGLHVLLGEKKAPQWLGAGKREKRVEKGDFIDNDFDNILDEIVMVMPCLQSPAYDADVIAIEGEAKAIVLRERINPPGIPFLGNHIRSNKEVEEYCALVTKALGLNGIHDIDLMTDYSGNIRVLEVNPRPSGSLAASLVAGYNLIDLAVSNVIGMNDIFIKKIFNDISVVPDNGDMKIV
jgi:carbamoylphosphate synthase large subunit